MTTPTAKTLKLGNKYRDKLHGREGTAVAHTRYLSGCDQVQLEWMKDGSIHALWFDIVMLEGVKVRAADKKPGGPKPHAPPRSHA